MPSRYVNFGKRQGWSATRFWSCLTIDVRFESRCAKSWSMILFYIFQVRKYWNFYALLCCYFLILIDFSFTDLTIVFFFMKQIFIKIISLYIQIYLLIKYLDILLLTILQTIFHGYLYSIIHKRWRSASAIRKR